MTEFLVVVHAPKPEPSTVQQMSSTYTVATPDVAKRITAPTAAKAAEDAGVAPGGYVEVVELKHVRRFDRARTAPLVEADPSGRPLPLVEAA